MVNVVGVDSLGSMTTKTIGLSLFNPLSLVDSFVLHKMAMKLE